MWGRHDDKYDEHGKTRRLRRSHATKRRDSSAAGVWVQAWSWSNRARSDGFIPEEVVETFDDDWQSIAQRLVDAAFWAPDEVDGEPGWRMVNFADYNFTRAKLERRERLKHSRNALDRDPRLKKLLHDRDKGRCRYCGCRLNKGTGNGPSAFTWDHVVPVSRGGPNTFDNVVSACKGCNDTKGDRTPDEAGMPLLAPGSEGAPQRDEEFPLHPERPAVDPESSTPEGSQHGTGRVGSGRHLELNSEFNSPGTCPSCSSTDYVEVDGTELCGACGFEGTR